VIYETDANNTITAEYSWDDNGNPVTMTKGGKIYYYHVNGHSDVTALTDENGNVVAQYEYDAWGNTISKAGSMAESNPYRYAGYRYDENTGLYYLLARYYSPVNGRFLSEDPVFGELKNPVTQNRYSYAGNNPAMYIDQDGRFRTLVRWLSSALIKKIKKEFKDDDEPSFKTGAAGEKYLKQLVGGRAQVYFKTSLGGRYVDQLANGIAHESKVGYVTLSKRIKEQVQKDAELIKKKSIRGAVWHFFRSAVTGKIGGSKNLLNYLRDRKIDYIIYD
jgi:RHS repeat-associated protein